MSERPDWLPASVKLESDGTPFGTKVVDPATGKDLAGVIRRIDYCVEVGQLPRMVVEFVMPPASIMSPPVSHTVVFGGDPVKEGEDG